jgi:signal transduction histidine kinase
MAAGSADRLDEALRALARLPATMGWRWRVLAAWSLLICVGVFFQARWLGQAPTLPLQLQAGEDGQIIIRDGSAQARHLDGHRLTGLSATPDAQSEARPHALALHDSPRWLTNPAQRAEHHLQRDAISDVLDAVGPDGTLWVRASPGEHEGLTLLTRGWLGLGTMYWLTMAAAVVTSIVGASVALSATRWNGLAYGALVQAQAAGLAWAATQHEWGWMAPPWWLEADLPVRQAIESLSLAALAYLSCRIAGRRSHVAALVTACTLLALAGAAATWQLPWWAWQAGGAALLAGLGWQLHAAHRHAPHPMYRVIRDCIAVVLGTWVLLSLALGLGQSRPDLQQPLARYGVLAWQLLAASLTVMVPFLSRSRHVFLAFSWLAASSAVAASLDLLFVAVFSLGVFSSMTLSLFLAFGVYLSLRHGVLSQLPVGQQVSREVLFERLYRLAREVERHPELLADGLRRLMRELFEPLSIDLTPSRLEGEQVALKGHGTVMVMALPTPQPPGTIGEACLVLRHAHRGQQLFSQADAQLVMHILAQLERVLDVDRAVERGRCEERQRIAQDLHDDIGARLLTLMYQAPTPDVEDYVRHTLQDLKTLTRGLAASAHPFSQAVSEWKRDLGHRVGVARCELDWKATWDEDLLLTMVQWSALTRILRELVSNALAHAHATQVCVTLCLQEQRLQLSVADNGRGGDPQTWAHGLGLGGVRKRVRQLGGSVVWEANTPRGIVCHVTVPNLSAAQLSH